jgi:hypothetical protein
MFDHYSQMTDLARKVAFQHPETQTTWQDAIRENRDSDLNFQSDSLSSECLLGSLAVSLGTSFHKWHLKLSRRPGWQAGFLKHGLALGRRS